MYLSMLHVPFWSLALLLSHQDTLTFSISLAPSTFPRHRASPSFPLHSFLPFNIVFSRMGFTEWRKGVLNPWALYSPSCFHWHDEIYCVPVQDLHDSDSICTYYTSIFYYTMCIFSFDFSYPRIIREKGSVSILEHQLPQRQATENGELGFRREKKELDENQEMEQKEVGKNSGKQIFASYGYFLLFPFYSAALISQNLFRKQHFD